MPVLPLHSLTSQSLDAKFANKQRRYATNYSASYLHQPSPPPRLEAPPRPPNPMFESLRAAAQDLNLPGEDEPHGSPVAATLPARRRPVRKALLGTTAALALCALAAGGYFAWTVRAPDGGLASGRVIWAAMTQRFHDLTANQPIFHVMDEKIATLRQALSQALTQAGPAARPVQDASAENPAARPAPSARPVAELAAPAAVPAPSASPSLPPSTPDASRPTEAVTVSRPPQPAEAAASTPEAAGPPPLPAQAEPAVAAAPPVVTPQQLVNTFALVRQMGLLVRDMQTENEKLRTQLADLTGTLQTKVASFEQRLAATAHDMRDAHEENAQLQAQVTKLADTLQGSSKALEQRLSLAPARGPAIAAEESGKRQADAPTAQAATPSGDGATAADAAAPGLGRTVRDYHVQAASLGVAVLGDANAMQGQASRYLVAVGDQVPGVGRVISITQRGTSWVVLTDHGVIQ